MMEKDREIDPKGQTGRAGGMCKVEVDVKGELFDWFYRGSQSK